MMLRQRIFEYVQANRLTFLCVGPMSRNCVDVAIELSHSQNIPMKLIASRRQIECEAMGSGYVEKWSTEKFVNYVKRNDRSGNVIVARDHGGPWQHPSEKEMNLARAMQSAKDSYTVDIESGMQVIHIDPSIDPSGEPTQVQLVERVMELYEHCWSVARRKKMDIAFEVGTEEQGIALHTAQDFKNVLEAIQDGCLKRGLPLPLFIVGQTGTKVMERRNIGEFEEFTRGRQPAELRELLHICNSHGILLKEHNTDYLSDAALALHSRIGVHAANVAPEFGVVETLAFMDLAERLKQNQILDSFIELAYSSRKWEKWMLPGTKANDRERAIICGHYVFATAQFYELKQQLSFAAKARKIELDVHLKQAIAGAMMRYLVHFGMVSAAKSHAA